jgi:hypothetical protein
LSRSSVRRSSFLVLLAALTPAAGAGERAAVSPAGTQQRSAPLVIVISVDQFRYDYLQRFAPWFTSRGFERFAREGATFTNARQRHSVTSTGPGHAAIGAGTLPSENGIVANRWLERDAPFDRARWQAYFDEVASYRPGATDVSSRAPARDPLRTGSAAASEGDSAKPRNDTRTAPQPTGTWWARGGSPRLAASHDPSAMLGDALSSRIDGHVVSVALTDRAAILMGGNGADAVYWFDGKAGRFVSSPHYRANESVLAFNDLVPGYMPAGRQWNVAHDEARIATFDPPAAWPLKNTLYGGTFPHPIPTIRALQYTPFAHEMVLDLALLILSVEQPDLLFVGISSTDYLGHLYGPDSLEVADSAIRLDTSLAAFLDAVERRYGDDVVVALTSDHGIQSIPEIARLRDSNAGAGRIDLRNPDPDARFIRDLPPPRIEIERRLAEKLDRPFSVDAPLETALVFFFEEPMLYLNPRHATEDVRRALRDVVRELEGVDGAWTRSERMPERLRNSFHPARSGDVLITLRPGWIWMWGSNSTTHGQPVEADLHVPLMLWGSGIVPGLYDDDVSPLDLARTLGRVLGIDAGGPESRVLPCVR